MSEKIVILHILIAAVLLYTTMYGCIGYGIYLGYKKCKQPPFAVVVWCMLMGLFGTGMFIIYLMMKG